MHDLFVQIIFYAFAGLAIFSAFFVVAQDNPVRCALFLVLAFFASTVLWILLEAEFLALILILVYVGAVMTLFLFVVMILNIDIEVMKTKIWRYIPFGLLIVALLTGLLIIALTNNPITNSLTKNTTSIISNTEKLGMVLYTDYVLAFEIAATILLVAIIAAITLVHRGARKSKQQNVVTQISTNAKDRLEIVKMKAEKR